MTAVLLVPPTIAPVIINGVDAAPVNGAAIKPTAVQSLPSKVVTLPQISLTREFFISILYFLRIFKLFNNTGQIFSDVY